PGGVYGVNNGTSMAAPHISGIAALLRGINPTLHVAELANIITSTATPLSTTLPNNESGWGRADAFSAVMRLINPAIITGTVRTTAGQGISGASVQAQSHTDPNLSSQVVSGEDGAYSMAVMPGTYDFITSAFGYYAQEINGVEATVNPDGELNFVLISQPTGIVQGQVSITNSGQPVTEALMISLASTPVSTAVSPAGSYRMTAPPGAYTLSVTSLGYRVFNMAINILANEVITHDIQLIPAPKLLLVDEGRWYFESQSAYWSQALNALGYTYDLRVIKSPPQDTPSYQELSTYDIVLWSSPRGAPGLVNGADPIHQFLSEGGRLFISGQNIAFFDGGGTYDTGPQEYLNDLLDASFAGELSVVNEIQGKGPFDGLQLPIFGQEGADNQISPDIIQLSKTDMTLQPWVFDSGQGAGSAVNLCTTYRAMFFGFGFEAINGEHNRVEVMRRSLDWLTTEPVTTGFMIQHITNPVQIGTAGQTITHSLAVRHIGIAGDLENVTVAGHG
ncbi:MAG: carboxypeptidase regulatory-like domain-containing protein, partial [Anaerolineae bacterium]|nr:carboxypeptidase regulatory-like domain-containing protein [Anaerolineae bacterium]